MSEKRKILVNADALDRLLRMVDPGGFQTNALGVTYVDDGTGTFNKLVEGGPDA